MCIFESTIYDCGCIIQAPITRCSQYYRSRFTDPVNILCDLDSTFLKAAEPCPQHKEPNAYEKVRSQLSKPWISPARRASRNASLKKRRAKKASKACRAYQRKRFEEGISRYLDAERDNEKAKVSKEAAGRVRKTVLEWNRNNKRWIQNNTGAGAWTLSSPSASTLLKRRRAMKAAYRRERFVNRRSHGLY